MTVSSLHRGVSLSDAALGSGRDGIHPVAPTEASSASSSGSTAFAGSALSSSRCAEGNQSHSAYPPCSAESNSDGSALPTTDDPYRLLSQGELNEWRHE